MATKLTDDERATIAQHLEQGLSRVQIARLTGRGVGTIDRVAKSIGFRADQSTASRVRRAQEARSAFSAERRATLAARLQVESERLLDDMHGPYLVWNFGGRDNTYAEHELPAPPVEARRQIVATVAEAQRTIIAIDKHDNRADEGLAAVDQWLRDMLGAAA